MAAESALPLEDRAVTDGWTPHLDEQRLLVLWVESGGAGRTTWTDPRLPLPAGFVERKDDHGFSYFLNTRRTFATADSSDITYEHEPDPREVMEAHWARCNDHPLPAGVVPVLDAHNRLVFLNSEAGTQTTTDPRLPLLGAPDDSSTAQLLTSGNPAHTQHAPARAFVCKSAWEDEYEPVCEQDTYSRTGITHVRDGQEIKKLPPPSHIDLTGYYEVRRRGDSPDAGKQFCMFFGKLRRGTVDLITVQREARLQASLIHPHIVRCWRCFESPTSIVVLFDLYPNGTMDQLAHATSTDNELHPAAHVAIWLGQLSSAVAFVHDRGLVLHAIEPKFVLVRPDPSNESALSLALSNVGLSIHVRRAPEPICFAPGFRAPEVLFDSKEPNQASDVWALGAIFLFCMTGRTPLGFSSLGRGNEAARRVVVPHPPVQCPELYAGKLWDAVQLALKRVPSKRPSASDLAKEFAAE